MLPAYYIFILSRLSIVAEGLGILGYRYGKDANEFDGITGEQVDRFRYTPKAGTPGLGKPIQSSYGL